MLQEKNGDLSALIKDIKFDAFPKHFGISALIITPIIIGGTVAAMKISEHIKNRREFREKEFKEKLETILDDGDQKEENANEEEEPLC